MSVRTMTACLLALALAGCQWGDSSDTDPQTVTVNVFGPSAEPPTTEDPATAIAKVTVEKFGEVCSDSVSPSGDAFAVRVGCRAQLTCTPRFADDSMVPPAIHGPTPDSFVQTSGFSFFELSATSEPFNVDARALAPGAGGVQCIVQGVRGALDLTVVP